MKWAIISGILGLVGCGEATAKTMAFSDSSQAQFADALEAKIQLQALYDNQKMQLQSALGDKAFVAAHQAILHDNELVTFAIWTDSVVTALPKVDFVWLQDAKMTRWFVVPWSELEAGVGKLAPLEGVDPPRYLTPANIPAAYFSYLEKNFVAPRGFPTRLARGNR